MGAMAEVRWATGLRGEALALLGLTLASACQPEPATAKDAGSVTAAAGWEMIIPPGARTYGAVALGTPGTIYALTNDSVYSVRSSHDDGKTWTTVDLTDTTSSMLSVAAVGSTDVFAVGYAHIDPNVDPPPLVAKSTDRGATFTLLHPTTFRGVFSAVADDGAGNPIGVGYDESGGFFVRSTDGGATWSQVPVPATGQLFALWTTASGTIYASGDAIASPPDGGTDAGVDAGSGNADPFAAYTGLIVRSDDGGATWTTVVTSPSSLFSISGTPDGQRIVAVGFAFNEVESTDGGATWRVDCGRNDTRVRDSDFASVWVPDATSSPFIAANASYVVRLLDCDYTGMPSIETSEPLPSPTVGLQSSVLALAGNATEVWAVGTGLFRRR
jgi:photosystem II stability/assembly factor-like uncharacterized protein